MNVVLLAMLLSGASDKLPAAPTVELAEMIELSAGAFEMGWPEQTAGPYGDVWFEDQQPQHTVTVSAFWLDRNEVTLAELALFLTYAGGEAHYHPDQPIERVAGGYLPIVGRGAEPAHQVTWQAAADYCAWAGKRLPTEAEWERAAAGLDARPFPWGNEAPTCARAVCFTTATFCAAGPQPAGREAGATPEGVHDLAGNVAEWTADWHGRYLPVAQTDPLGPANGVWRVIRGGGFLDSKLGLRTHFRRAAPPHARSDNVGFRCAYDAPERVAVPRATLRPPTDTQRVPASRPHTGGVELPEVLADGLVTPMGLTELDGTWYVADRGAGALVAVSEAGATAILTGLAGPTGVATDGNEVFVTDTDGGAVWRLVPGGEAALVAQSQNAPRAIAADAGAVVWGDQDVIRHVASFGEPAGELVTGLSGVVGLALDATDVYFAHTNSVGRVPRMGGAVETLVGSGELGASYTPTDVTLDSTGHVYFPIVLGPWPGSGFVCSVGADGSGFGCHSYSPPRLGAIAVVGTEVFWTTRLSVARFSLERGPPFTLPGTWTAAVDLVASPDAVVWTDRERGRVYRELW